MARLRESVWVWSNLVALAGRYSNRLVARKILIKSPLADVVVKSRNENLPVLPDGVRVVDGMAAKRD